jgi:NADH-quinone oxidoreductase subunit J
MNAFPLAPYIVAGAFAVALGAAIGGALIAVLATRLIRAVAGLMICCLGLAGLYYFLTSPFLALMEILIYVGAVCVTIVFAVMLAEPDEPVGGARGWGWTAATVAISGLVGFGLAKLSLSGDWPAPPAARISDGSVAAIGRSLLTTYSLAFEVVSLLLLLAILGALVIARAGRSPAKSRHAVPVSATVRPTPEPEAVLTGK